MELKGIFFRFLQEVIEVQTFEKIEWIPLIFCTFSGFFAKIVLILLTFIKLYSESVVDFIFSDKKFCWLFFYAFLSKILAKYFMKMLLVLRLKTKYFVGYFH